MSNAPLRAGSPYVQFSVELTTGQLQPRTVKHRALPVLAPGPTSLAITSDAAGRIVVRSLVGTNAVVCGTATLVEGRLHGHAQHAEIPWPVIEEALAREVDAARFLPHADRTTIDEAALGTVTPTDYRPPPPKRSAFIRGMQALGAVIVLAVGITGYYVVSGWWDRGTVGNGGTCTRDTECASRNCDAGVCRVSSAIPDGNPCRRDSECASGTCRSETVDGPRICRAR